MRILFLAKRRYTNKDALRERFGRVYQFPLNWHRSGHHVELLLIDYRGLKSESASPDGFPVTSLSLADPRSAPRLFANAKRLKPDVIVASGDCYIGLAAARVARAVGARFVFDVYDDYASFSSHSLLAGWDALGYLTRRAGLVLYASQPLALHHDSNARKVMAPNGVDPARFHPIPLFDARQRLGLGQETTWVGYFGSMEPDRGLDDLIAAVGILHASDSNIRLLLCGSKDPHSRSFPSWVDYHGVVLHSAMPAYLNACNVLALPYRRSRVMDMGASCKIAEYLLCGRPMVATDTPNFTQNFPVQARELGAYISRPSDPSDLARVISLQLQAPRTASFPVEHTWESISQRVLGELETLVKRPRGD